MTQSSQFVVFVVVVLMATIINANPIMEDQPSIVHLHSQPRLEEYIRQSIDACTRRLPTNNWGLTEEESKPICRSLEIILVKKFAGPNYSTRNLITMNEIAEK